MNELRRNGRIARLIAAIMVVVTAAVVFASLGGIRLARSAIGLDQYGAARHITIVKASAARTGVVALRVVIIGWKMYPALVGKPLNSTDGGHWAIFVDGRCNNVSASSTKGATSALRKGLHKIYTELANNDGTYLIPAVKSNPVKVRITRTVGPRPSPAARLCLQEPPGAEAS